MPQNKFALTKTSLLLIIAIKMKLNKEALRPVEVSTVVILYLITGQMVQYSWSDSILVKVRLCNFWMEDKPIVFAEAGADHLCVCF